MSKNSKMFKKFKHFHVLACCQNMPKLVANAKNILKHNISLKEYFAIVNIISVYFLFQYISSSPTNSDGLSSLMFQNTALLLFLWKVWNLLSLYNPTQDLRVQIQNPGSPFPPHDEFGNSS